jgi:hypothetical protein
VSAGIALERIRRVVAPRNDIVVDRSAARENASVEARAGEHWRTAF